MQRAFDLPPWDRAALEYMRGRANVEGTMGVMLVDSPEAVAWADYFDGNDLPLKANNLRYRVSSGATYMVPTRWPWEYDTSWHRRQPMSDSVVRRKGRPVDVEATAPGAGSRSVPADEPF